MPQRRADVDSTAQTTLRAQPPHVRLRQILDAAERLIVEHGYEGMTMDQVAAAAGIAKGTIYLYFPSKQSLLAGMQADVAQRFQLDGAEAVGSTPPEFAAFLKAEMQKWSKVIREAGIKPE